MNEENYSIAETVSVEITNPTITNIAFGNVITLNVFIDYFEEAGLPAQVSLTNFENLKVNGFDFMEWAEDNRREIECPDDIQEEIFEAVKEELNYSTTGLVDMIEEAYSLIE